MTGWACPECGRRLLGYAGQAGIEAGCPACGATVVVPGTPAAPPPLEEPGPDLPDPSSAPDGDVPPPRPSGAASDAQIPLALSAASLLLPLLGPFAWWQVERAARPIRDAGSEEPDSLRHARLLAITGTVLLIPVLLCLGLVVLRVG